MPSSDLITKEYEKNAKKEPTKKDDENAWAASFVGGRKSRRAKYARRSVKKNKKVVSRKSLRRK